MKKQGIVMKGLNNNKGVIKIEDTMIEDDRSSYFDSEREKYFYNTTDNNNANIAVVSPSKRVNITPSERTYENIDAEEDNIIAPNLILWHDFCDEDDDDNENSRPFVIESRLEEIQIMNADSPNNNSGSFRNQCSKEDAKYERG